MKTVLISVLFLGAFQARAIEPTCDLFGANRALQEIRELVFGADPLAPTPQSALGAFIAATGTQAVVRELAPRDASIGAVPQRKLIIPVSPNSYAAFQDLLRRFPQMLQVVNTPNTDAYSYLGYRDEYFDRDNRQNWTFPPIGSVAPVILLKDSEAERLHTYLNGIKSMHSGAVYPWRIAGYGWPQDAYTNCSSWCAHIPLGDNVMAEVFGTPKLDRHGGVYTEKGTLTDFQAPANLTPEQGVLLKKIWQAPTHQRLLEVLGHDVRAGNHTGTGWFVHLLMAGTGIERVPVVFIFVDDHTQALPDPVNLQINFM